MGRQLGRGMAEFRKFRDSFDDDLKGFLGHDEHDEEEKPKPSGRELPPADTGGKHPVPASRDRGAAVTWAAALHGRSPSPPARAPARPHTLPGAPETSAP